MLKAGIVGLPNVGKSTLFNTITNLQVEAANYPFATIEPNVGIVKVNDERLYKLANLINPQKITPAICTFTDIAGLVKGASVGEGLGNKFLANIREVHTIIHVVRCFDNPDITHYYSRINPVEDIKIINMELILSDLEVLNTRLIKVIQKAKSGDKESQIEEQILKKLITILEKEQFPNISDFNNEEKKIINNFNLLTTKPVIYVCNIAEDNIRSFDSNIHYLNVKKYLNDKLIIPISISIEYEISKLDNDSKNEYMEMIGLKKPSIDNLIKTTYDTLGLQTFFTFGADETKAWTFYKGMTAPECAGIIHSDIQNGFIRAEICNWKDLVEYGSELKTKENGKLRLEGKEYVMNDGDVVYFRFNVSNKKK